MAAINTSFFLAVVLMCQISLSTTNQKPENKYERLKIQVKKLSEALTYIQNLLKETEKEDTSNKKTLAPKDREFHKAIYETDHNEMNSETKYDDAREDNNKSTINWFEMEAEEVDFPNGGKINSPDNEEASIPKMNNKQRKKTFKSNSELIISTDSPATHSIVDSDGEEQFEPRADYFESKIPMSKSKLTEEYKNFNLSQENKMLIANEHKLIAMKNNFLNLNNSSQVIQGPKSKIMRKNKTSYERKSDKLSQKIVNGYRAMILRDENSSDNENINKVNSRHTVENVKEEIIKICPRYRCGSSCTLDFNKMVGTWQVAYFQMPKKLTCFKINIIKVSKQKKEKFQQMYGTFNGSIDWSKCDLEVKSSSVTWKHFLQYSSEYPAGLLKNILIIKSERGSSLREEESDQWFVYKDKIMLLRDCITGEVVAFTKHSYVLNKHELGEALKVFGEEQITGKTVCNQDKLESRQKVKHQQKVQTNRKQNEKPYYDENDFDEPANFD